MAITLSDIQTRYAYLIGDADTTNLTAVDTSHINAFVRDVCNAYPFSWNQTTSNLTLSSGASNLPANYNTRWGLVDARIVTAGTDNDNIFTRIPYDEKDNYSSSQYVYWITYDATNNVHVFNTPVQSGTVAILYNFEPTAMSGSADVCVVPDLEAVAYGAAAKYWIPDERNPQLAQEYERQASERIGQLWTSDNQFGALPTEGNVVDLNSDLIGG